MWDLPGMTSIREPDMNDLEVTGTQDRVSIMSMTAAGCKWLVDNLKGVSIVLGVGQVYVTREAMSDLEPQMEKDGLKVKVW